MKTIFAFFLAVVLGIVLGVATASFRIAQAPCDGNPPILGNDSAIKPSDEPIQPAPKLEMEQSKFDFGSMDIEEKGSHDFLVKNSGNSPLIISAGGVTCGCLICDLAHLEIPPGESDEITIEWKSKGRLGEFSEAASFTTNDPVKTEFTLTISGQITAKFEVIPAELVFNDISANESVARQVRLLCYQDEPWEAVGHRWEVADIAANFEASLEALTAEQLKEDTKARSGYLVKVTVKPGLPYGPFQQKIRIQTSSKDRPEIIIPIQGAVTSDIKVAGPAWDDENGVLSLGIVNGRQGIRQRMLLIVRGPFRKEVKFKALDNPDLPIKARLGETTEINNGLVTQTPLTIEIPEGSRPVNHLGKKPSDWGEINVETTHPEIPKIRILVRFAIEG